MEKKRWKKNQNSAFEFLVGELPPRKAFCCSQRRSSGDGSGPLHRDDGTIGLGPPIMRRSAVGKDLPLNPATIQTASSVPDATFVN